MSIALNIQGMAEVKRAFDTLEAKVAKKVIRRAERDAIGIFQAEILAHVPIATGRLKRTVKIRASKGPRGFKKNIAIVVLAGQAGGAQVTTGKSAWYGYLQEKGYHVGKRIRKAGKVEGYIPLAGHLGMRGVRHMPGKHFVKNALRSREADVRQKFLTALATGIEREAAAMAARSA